MLDYIINPILVTWNFLMVHQVEMVAAIAAIHSFAVILVNLTTTPTDNAVLIKVYRVFEVIGGLIFTRAKFPTPSQSNTVLIKAIEALPSPAMGGAKG